MSAHEMAGRLTAAMAALPDFGDDLNSVELNRRPHREPESWLYADVRLSVYADGDVCERYGVVILKAHPDAQLERMQENFAITCAGAPSWSIYFSNSVCKRVQVGTTTKMAPAPDAPMIEVEEPVYEWRCADPILDAGLVTR